MVDSWKIAVYNSYNYFSLYIGYSANFVKVMNFKYFDSVRIKSKIEVH